MSQADRTALEVARTRLQAAHANLLAALDLAEDGYAFTLDGVVVWANTSAARMLGFGAASQLANQPLTALQSQAACTVSHMRGSDGSRKPVNRSRHEIRRVDGSCLTIEASSLPFQLDEQTLLLSTARDVSMQVADRYAFERSKCSLLESQRIAHIGSWEYDLRDNSVLWSRETYRMFEREPRDITPTYATFLEAVHPEDRDAVASSYWRSLAERTPYESTHRLLMRDGRIKYVHGRCETLYDDANRPLRSVGTLQDVTERVEVELQLRRERNFSSAVLESMGGLVVVLDRQGRIRGFNCAAEELSGLSFAEVEGKFPWETFLPPDCATRVRQEAFDAMINDPRQTKAQYTNHWLTRDGSRRLIEWSNVLLRDAAGAVEFMVCLGIDVTERRAAEDRIKLQLTEKEVLLKEVHHRVKNNLQVVSSLLYLQAEQAADAEVSAILYESRERVRAMAMVHETLYQSGKFGQVDFRSYVDRLITGVRIAFRRFAPVVAIEVEVNAAPLDLEVAVPCGLLVNELLTNAFKHAFAGRASGAIRVTLTERVNQYRLAVQDNGIGLSQRQTAGRRTSLGLQLVRALTAQLGGALTITNRDGTECAVAFPRPESQTADSAQPL